MIIRDFINFSIIIDENIPKHLNHNYTEELKILNILKFSIIEHRVINVEASSKHWVSPIVDARS